MVERRKAQRDHKIKVRLSERELDKIRAIAEAYNLNDSTIIKIVVAGVISDPALLRDVINTGKRSLRETGEVQFFRKRTTDKNPLNDWKSIKRGVRQNGQWIIEKIHPYNSSPNNYWHLYHTSNPDNKIPLSYKLNEAIKMADLFKLG